jgi:hypothetical protein
LNRPKNPTRGRLQYKEEAQGPTSKPITTGGGAALPPALGGNMTKVIRFVKVTKKGSEGKCRPIEDITNLLNKGALHHTLEAIHDPPGPGEVE